MEGLAAAIISLVVTVVSTVAKTTAAGVKTSKQKTAQLNNRLAYMYANRNYYN